MSDPNPSGICQCGCRKPVPSSPRTYTRYGVQKGEHFQYLHGHYSKTETFRDNADCCVNLDLKLREKNGNWRGGRYISSTGYVCVKMSDGAYEFEHRVVAAEMLGRPLNDDEVIHHINEDNEDKADNRKGNLQVMPNFAEHMRLHRRMRAALLTTLEGKETEP